MSNQTGRLPPIQARVQAAERDLGAIWNGLTTDAQIALYHHQGIGLDPTIQLLRDYAALLDQLREDAAPLRITLPDHKNDDDLSRSPSPACASTPGSPRKPLREGSRRSTTTVRLADSDAALIGVMTQRCVDRACEGGDENDEQADSSECCLQFYGQDLVRWCDMCLMSAAINSLLILRESATSIDARLTQAEEGTAIGSATASPSSVPARLTQEQECESCNGWRSWAQFVYGGGGPVTATDAELKAAVCVAHDRETIALREQLQQARNRAVELDAEVAECRRHLGVALSRAEHAEARETTLRATLEQIQTAVAKVVHTFKADEAQGYRSRDRQFAIEILSRALSALLADPLLQGITDDENALGLPGSADTKG